MMKGNLCTTYAENYRNAGENALKQHILTPVFAELNVVISLPLLVLNFMNPQKMRIRFKISSILTLIEVAVIIWCIFKCALRRLSRGTAKLLNSAVTVRGDYIVAKNIGSGRDNDCRHSCPGWHTNCWRRKGVHSSSAYGSMSSSFAQHEESNTHSYHRSEYQQLKYFKP